MSEVSIDELKSSELETKTRRTHDVFWTTSDAQKTSCVESFDGDTGDLKYRI